MSAYCPAAPRPGLPARAFLFLAPLLAAAAAAFPLMTNTHGVERHGDEARAIRQCLDQNGPYQVWYDRKADMYFLLCQLPDGRWGATLAKRIGNAWSEVTSYVKGDGSWTRVLQWLTRQGAARITTPFP